MKDMEIIKKEAAALSALVTGDLSNREKAAALVSTAHAINEQYKAIKAEDAKVKAEFKRLCAPYIEDGHGVTVYNFDERQKMSIILSGGGVEVDENALLSKLYELYGEEPGDKTGRAWRAGISVSDPVETRVLNPDKLAAEVAKAERVRLGVEGGTIRVPGALVAEASVVKAPTVSAKCSAMTKAEVAAHEAGELTEPMEVR